MDNRSIGIFDSGLGGLTSVCEIIKILPNENIVYFGDTGRVPYGSRSVETIVKYVRQDINFLQSFNVKIIISACGTASSVALPVVKKDYEIELMSVLEPSFIKASKVTINKKIGILGTERTIKSGRCVEILKNIDPEIVTVSKACPMFVPLVENGYVEGSVTSLIVEEYLNVLKQEIVDTIVLACTHFPLLKRAIKNCVGSNMKLIDSGKCVVEHAKDFLKANNMLSDNKGFGKIKYFVSDSCESFINSGKIFLKKDISGCVDQIEIEKY
ncbi:MAG: glutamate racemase [Clostridiales bacterium]|nr:glutamate racemase [Clostridiales bacterium]